MARMKPKSQSAEVMFSLSSLVPLCMLPFLIGIASRPLLFASALSAPQTNASQSLTSLSCSAQPKQSPTVRVWDDVLNSIEHRVELHNYAAKLGLGHKCFSRPIQNRDERNIIELTLDAILTQMENNNGPISIDGNGSQKQYVEYWTRQEWRHIEAHADVDESLAKYHDANPPNDDDNNLQTKFPATLKKHYRYPTHGHVLYLKVGSEVKGPTCVFPGRSSGGDLLKPLQRNDSYNIDSNDIADEKEGESAAENDNENQVQLITVPAKAGRLLRFHGQDLHAVPRPHDLWMLPFVKGSPETEPEEVWGRSVILFNVWPGEEDPPLEVPLDANDEDCQVSDDGALCNNFENWVEVPIVPKSIPSSPPEAASANKSVKVWLLGNERRRDYPMRTVPLFAPEEGGREVVREALAEESQVTELWLRQTK